MIRSLHCNPWPPCPNEFLAALEHVVEPAGKREAIPLARMTDMEVRPMISAKPLRVWIPGRGVVMDRYVRGNAKFQPGDFDYEDRVWEALSG